MHVQSTTHQHIKFSSSLLRYNIFTKVISLVLHLGTKIGQYRYTMMEVNIYSRNNIPVQWVES